MSQSSPETETAIKAIERWQANRLTSFTPSDILLDFSDLILTALRSFRVAQTGQVTDGMVRAGAIGIVQDVADHDGGPSFHDLSEKSQHEALAVSRACLTAALSDTSTVGNGQPERCPTCKETDAAYKYAPPFRRCNDPWHGDDHLRTHSVTSPTREGK
jgi:hypothetical protein